METAVILIAILVSMVTPTKMPSCHRELVCTRTELWCNGHPYTGGSCGGVQLVCTQRQLVWVCE